MKDNRETALTAIVERFQGTEIRIVELDGKHAIVAADAAAALGYKQTKDFVHLVRDKYKGFAAVETPGGEQRVTVIVEAGLWEALAGSGKPLAEQFQDWLYEEALPKAARGEGSLNGQAVHYQNSEQLMQTALQTQQMVVAMMQDKGKQIDQVQQQMNTTRQEFDATRKRVDELDALILDQDVKEQRRIAFDTYQGENATEMRNVINAMARNAAQAYGGLHYGNVYTMLYTYVVKPVYAFDVYQKERGSDSWLKACTVEELMLVRDAVSWLFGEEPAPEDAPTLDEAIRAVNSEK